MSDIDFAKIIQQALTVTHGEGVWVLDAKVPELCPDCQGEGVVFCADDDDIGDGCDHPNAPTIAKLLAIGAAVMTAEVTEDYDIDYELGDWVSIDHGDSSTISAKHLLVALREVS